MEIRAAVKGLSVGVAVCLAIGGLAAAVRVAKRSGRSGAGALLVLFLQFFGAGVPPPRQTIEDARKAEDKNRSQGSGRDRESERR